MEEQKTKQKKLPENWKDSINPQSLKRAIDAGDIPPKVDISGMGMNDTLTVKFLDEPILVKHEKLPNGEGYFAIVEQDGVKKSMACSGSMLFNLAKELETKKIDSVVGYNVKIGKTIGKTQYSNESVLYWAQIVTE